VYENFNKEQSSLLSILKNSIIEKSHKRQNSNFTHSEITYIIDQANYHNVIPLVALAFNSEYYEYVPKPLVEKINELNREIVIKNLYLLNELSSLNNLFTSKEIEFLLLKGPAVGAELYKDINLRHFRDLDLLVRKEDIDAALNLLLENGYKYSFNLTDRQEKLYKKSSIYLTDHDNQYTFIHREKMIIVELHWALMPEQYSFFNDTESLFDRKKKIKINDIEFNTLNDEDNILFLSVHGIKHGWSRLYWLCDIVCFLITKKSIDWSNVLIRAKALNCRRQLCIALNVSNIIVPGLLNEKLIGIIKNDNVVEMISGRILENVFNNDPYIELENNNKIFIGSMEHFSDKMRYYFDKLFRPTIYEVEVIVLPKKLSFLYYILRPLRLIKKYLLKIFSY